MIMGYPGGTERFLTSFGVKMAVEQTGPSIVKIRTKKLELMQEDMDADEGVRIKYIPKQASTSNYWKYYIGQTEGLKRLKIYEKKKELEKEFTEWIYSSDNINVEYRNALKYIGEAYKVIEQYQVAEIYFSEAGFRGSEIIPFTRNFYMLNQAVKAKTLNESMIHRDMLREITDKHFKDYNLETDKKIFTALMIMYYIRYLI